MADKSDDSRNIVEVLQHRVAWSLRGEGAPSELDEASQEHIETCIREGYNQGELHALSADGETEYRGWWEIDNACVCA